MKSLFIVLVIMSSTVFADTTKVSSEKKEEGTVQSIVKEGKKERKKKVEMCHDCGKPETECTCEGEEHGKKE